MKEKFKNIVSFFKKLDKKRKALLIIIIILKIAIISLLIFYFVDKNKKVENKPKEKVIIKDNYSYSNGTLTFLDGKKELGTYKCKNKDEDLCYVAYLSTEDDFTIPQYVYEDGAKVADRTDFYKNQYAFVYDNTKDESLITLYDFKNNEVVDTYKSVKSYYLETANNPENNYVVLQNTSGKYGMLNLESKTIDTIIDFKYDYLGIIRSTEESEDYEKDYEFIITKTSNKWSVISFFEISFDKYYSNYNISEQIVNCNYNYIITRNSKEKYSVYDYSGQLILKDQNYIDLYSEYILAVNSSNKLNLYTCYSGYVSVTQPLNLKNTDYVKTMIVNENLEVSETKYSFRYEYTNEEFIIYIKNGDNEIKNTININEAQYSIERGYSYLDGKLYFYSDEEKTELVGSYKCKNENNISNSEVYCFPEYETISGNDVIFNRYVVIYDSKSNSDSEIKYYLYDLKNSKLLGNYIDFSATGISSFLPDDNVHYFISENKSSEYGVLKLTKDGASILIPFDYNNIVDYGKYFLAKLNNKNTWYDTNGVKIINNTFTYISFKENYVVVVDEKLLLLFDYNGKQLISTPVTLNKSIGISDVINNISDYYIITETDAYYSINNLTETKNFSKTDGSIIP